MPKKTYKIKTPKAKPFSKMTKKDCENWILWAENEINEYSRFIVDVRKRLKVLTLNP